jgi:hypothetical protein
MWFCSGWNVGLSFLRRRCNSFYFMLKQLFLLRRTSEWLRNLDIAFKRLLVEKWRERRDPKLFCSWFIFWGVSCLLVFTVLTSGHLVFWFSGMRSAYGFLSVWRLSLLGSCCLYLPPLLLSHDCWATLRFIAISTFIGSYGVFAAISWFWLAASFVNTIISALLPSRAVILCLRFDFLFIWFESFRLDLPSSSSWSISFV